MGEAVKTVPRKPSGRRDSSSTAPQVTRPRMDMWSNPAVGLGGRNGRNQCNVWVPRLRLIDRALEELYGGSKMIARIVDREPDDATREGFKVDGLTPQDQTKLDDFIEDQQFLTSLADASRWSRLYGLGGAMMIVEDGRSPDMPVDIRNIFAVRRVHVFDKTELSVESWETDINMAGFGKPRRWRISMGGAQFVVHADRMLIFDGVKLPRKLMQQRDGGGGSVVDQVYEQFSNWGVTHAYMSESITQLTQGVLTIPDLNKAIKSGNGKAVKRRMQEMMRGMSVIGDIVLGEGEQYGIQTRTVTGFKEALEAFTAALVAVTDMPESILLGRVPGGLNSGEAAGEWRSWSTHVDGQQTLRYTPLARRYLNYVLASSMSPISESPDRIAIEWNPLIEPDPEQDSKIHQANATARATDINSGVITPDEARRQDDVAESYNLEDHEIAQAGENTDARNKSRRLSVPDPVKLGQAGQLKMFTGSGE